MVDDAQDKTDDFNLITAYRVKHPPIIREFDAPEVIDSKADWDVALLDIVSIERVLPDQLNLVLD
jgi:hypothetical protein